MVKAEKIMRENAVTMDKSKGFKGALDIMLHTKTDYIIVTDKNKPLGIITERDILKKLVAHQKSTPKIKLENCMSDGLISIKPGTDIGYMSQLMTEEDIRHLPVIDHNKLEGVVTSNDIVKETTRIEGRNQVFSRWQNIQTGIIAIFFVFLFAYFVIRLLMA